MPKIPTDFYARRKAELHISVSDLEFDRTTKLLLHWIVAKSEQASAAHYIDSEFEPPIVTCLDDIGWDSLDEYVSETLLHPRGNFRSAIDELQTRELLKIENGRAGTAGGDSIILNVCALDLLKEAFAHPGEGLVANDLEWVALAGHSLSHDTGLRGLTMSFIMPHFFVPLYPSLGVMRLKETHYHVLTIALSHGRFAVFDRWTGWLSYHHGILDVAPLRFYVAGTVDCLANRAAVHEKQRWLGLTKPRYTVSDYRTAILDLLDCGVLTREWGMLRYHPEKLTFLYETQNCANHPPDRPRWNAKTRHLQVGDQIVLSLATQAKSLINILSQFEKSQWPESGIEFISQSVSGKTLEQSRTNVRGLVKNLNNKQSNAGDWRVSFFTANKGRYIRFKVVANVKQPPTYPL